MTEAKCQKDLGLPIRIDGSTRFVKGATKYTTCGDVIKMVLKKTGIQKEYRHLFCIYESTKDGERALSCKTRIMKEMKNWNDVNNRFILRKIDPIGQRPNVVIKEADFRPQKKVVRVISTDNGIQIESSGSDSSDASYEDFLSKVDHTKLINFVKLFNAITTNETNKMADRYETKPEPEHSHAVPKRPQTGTNAHHTRQAAQQTPSRQRIKHTRRSRSSHNLHDRHPNKIHRVDYGYVDRASVRKSRGNDVIVKSRSTRDMPKRVPAVNTDSVSDFLKAHVEAEAGNQKVKDVDSSKSKKGARRVLHFTKYFTRSGKRKSDDACAKEKSTTVQLPGKATDYFIQKRNNVCHQRVGGFEVLDDCREIWDDRMRQEVDSGHDDSSDISSSLYPGYSTPNTCSSPDMSICANEICDNRDFLNNVPTTKLVDYSISSDDEYETDDEFHKSYENDIFNSHLSDVSSGNSNDDVDGFTNVTSYIKGVFSRKHFAEEDEEMDSFMKSRIYEESTDEGVSSLESGLDKVYL